LLGSLVRAQRHLSTSNGYCFSSSLGQRTFNNADCWTRNPTLSQWEQRRVAQIQAEERRRGCKVNN
jgi:hypothetical protein